MDAIEAIMTRRSIRLYADTPIDDGTIETLLRAGMQAPSARNAQPWHFLVITDRAILSAIRRFHPYSDMLATAAAAILICGDPGLEEDLEYINQDCTAATENILLASHALGLGAVWLGIYPREKRIVEIRRLLDIPGRIVPVSLIALGYPAESAVPVDRYQPQRVYRNRWGNLRRRDLKV
jgi:nitroreductase